MYGYWGKILWVDLTSGDISTQEFDEAFAKKWLGGVGFGVKLLYDNIPAGADPMGPDNIFFIGVGPIQGKTGVLGSGRFTLSFKSPLTGFWGNSTGGGHLAEAVKKAGWDGIAVKGAADKPVYIHINEDKVEIKDASAVWGKDIRETQDALRKEVGDDKAQIMPIGQGGENLVKYAAVCIEDGHGNAARMGSGTVMGSKKLKAIVIQYDMAGYGPEYETLGMMGSNALIDDLKAINYAGHLCNMWGIDTIDFGGALGFAIEAFEKGFIKEEDLGFPLAWGDAEGMIKLLELVTFRKNEMGELLGEGVYVAAEKLGCPELAVTVNNAIIPAHDGRAFFSMAVNYATGPRGPCHVTGFSEGSELGVPLPYYDLPGMDRFSLDLKGKAAMAWQDWAMFDNSLTYCLFYDFAGYSHEWKSDIVNAITGWDTTSTEMLVELGGRICQLIRMFNLKHGFMPTKNDTLPPRMFQPLAEGGAAGKVPPLTKMLAEYYEARGWVNGVPTKDTLAKFGIEDTAKDLKDFPVLKGLI